MNLNYQRFVANANLLRTQRPDLQIPTTGGRAPIAIIEPPEVQAAIANQSQSQRDYWQYPTTSGVAKFPEQVIELLKG